MAENYKISLGIDFNDSELKNIKKQLTNLTDNTHRVRIDIDNSRLLKQIEHAKKELKELNSAKGNQPSLTVNTQSLEKSLSRVADVIEEVRKSLGTLDDKSGMKSLLSSVNQIATALGKVENESDNLVKSLSALSKKDFSINFDLKMGGSNPVTRNTNFGRKVRNEVLPELQKQVKAYEDYFAKYYEGKYRKGSSPLSGLLTGSSVWGKNKTNVIDINQRMADPSNLEEQIKAYKQYISIIKEAASLKGIDVSSVTSQFSTSAEKLVKDTIDIKTGAKEAEENLNKLKGIFGGSLDVEGLSGQLQPIIADLGEIKTALQSLSSNSSIDGLTQSFNRLSETLEKLTANLTLAKNTLDTGFSDAAPVDNAIRTAQQTGQKIGEAVGKSATQSAKQSINLDDVIDEQVLRLMNEYAIAGDKGSKAFKEIRQSLVDFRNGSGGINKVTSAISNNMKVVNDAKNDYKELAEQIKWFNSNGAKVHLPDSIKQEYGDDFESMRKQLGSGRLGNAFTTGQGMDFESFIVELNGILGQTIDLSHGVEAAFGDLVRKVNSTKAPKFLTGDDLFRSGRLDMGDVVADVSTSLEQIENAEAEIARTSTASANTVVQNGERKQQAYRETSGVIENLKTTLETMRVDRSSIDAIIKDIEKLGFTAKNTSVEMKNGGFDITVKGVDSIGRAITEIRHFDKANGISFVGRKISQPLAETDKFIKQQKKSVADLTNQINQLNRSAIDQNANRPIKDSDHLDSLSSKYNEIISAIQRMGSASSGTFDEEVSNVRTLISEYKSLIREFRNAENASSQMKGNDYESGRSIAKRKYEKFLADAKGFSVDTSKLNIDSVTDVASLNKFTDALRVAKAELDKLKAEAASAKREIDSSNREKSLGIDVDSLRHNIESLQKISPEIKNFKTEINGAEVTVDSLLNSLGSIDTQSDFRVVRKNFESFTRAAQEAGIAVTESQKKLAEKKTSDEEAKKVNQVYKAIYDTKKRIGSLEVDLIGAEDTKDVQALRNEIERLKNSLLELDKEGVSSKFTDKQKSRLKELDEQIKFDKKRAENKADTKLELQIDKEAAAKVKKDTKETEESFKKLKRLATEMGKIDIELAGLTDVDKDLDKFNTLKRMAEELEVEFNVLREATNLNPDQIRELDQIFANTTGAVRELNKELAKSAETKELTAGFERLKTIAKEINGLKIDIFKFEDADNIERASNRLNELENEAAELRATLQQKFNVTSFDEVDEIARKGEEALDALIAKAEEDKAKLADSIKADIDLGNFENEIDTMRSKFNSLSDANVDLRASVELVEQAYKEMLAAANANTGDEVADRERLIQAEKEYAAALEKTNNLIKQQERADKIDADAIKLQDSRELFQAKIDVWMEKNSAATKKFGAHLLDLRAKAETADQVELNHLEKELLKVDKTADKAGLKMQSLGDQIKSKFKEYMAYFSVAEVFMYVEQGLREMFNTVKEIDTAMTGLYRVTDLTSFQYDTLFNNMISSAKEYGATLNDIINATTDWVRAGFDADVALGMAEVTTMYQHISDLDYDTAAENLITAYNGFKNELNGAFDGDQVAAVNYIADILNELDKQNCPLVV